MSLDEKFEMILNKFENSKTRDDFFYQIRDIEASYDVDSSVLNFDNQIRLLYEIGLYYKQKYNCSKSIKYFNKAFDVISKLGIDSENDEKINELKSIVKQELGYLYIDIGDVKMSEDSFVESLYWGTLGETCKVSKAISLYCYRDVNTYFLKDIINNTLTVVHPKLFNDPFDCLIYSTLKKYGKYDKVLSDVLSRVYDSFKIRSFVCNKKVNGDKEVNCISECVKENEYNNFLMWSHYAKDHKGVCVRYKLASNFTYANNDKFTSLILCNMNYEKNYKVKNRLSYTFKDAFTLKNKCWEYENEFRLIYFDPSCKSDYRSLSLGNRICIEAIYFGVKYDIGDRSVIKNILGNEIAYYQMEQSDFDYFLLTAVPLNKRAEELLKEDEVQ